MSELRKTTIGLGMAVALAASQTNAQLLEEVVVTAQKREQSAQDISISVNAFTGEQLSDLGVVGAKELADFTPGVQINMEYGNAPTFTIRGVNVNDFGVGTSPAAAVYVDGIYKASNINSGPQLFDLERVEILKGPQGTLWGKNTTGGAINVTTRKPTQEREGYIQVGYGNFDRVEFEGAIGGGLTDTLSARLSIQSITADGPYDNVTFPGQPTPGTVPIDGTTDSRTQFFGQADSDPGDVDTLAVRGQLLWENGPFSALAIAHYATDKGENAPTTSIVNDPDPLDEDVSNDFVYERDSEFWGVSLELQYDFNDNMKLVSITGYDYFDRDGGIDTLGGGGANGLGIPAESAFTQIYLVEMEQISQELRLELTGDNYFWLLGMYYSDTHINQNDEDHYSLGYFFAPFNNRYEHENNDISVFSHGEYAFNDQWKLIAGIRYTDEERDQPFYATWYGASGFGPDNGGSINDPVDSFFGFNTADNRNPAAPDQTYDTSGFSFKVGVDWTPRDDMLLYYNFSKGLKSGGFRSDAFTGLGELVAFNDEKLFAHEIGMKWDPTDRLRLNVSAFYYDYQDIQQRVPIVIPGLGQLTTLSNLDSADVYGLEFEMLFNVSDGFDVGLNGSIMDSELNEDRLVNGLPVDGNKLPFAPDVAISGFARYEAPVTDVLRGSIQVNVNYTGDHYVTVNAGDDVWPEQDYTTVAVNAAIWDDNRGWELSFYGKNLTNEFYVTNAFGGSGIFINEPRQFGARINYSF